MTFLRLKLPVIFGLCAAVSLGTLTRTWAAETPKSQKQSTPHKSLQLKQTHQQDRLLLSIDGGGLFGIIPAFMLKEVSQCMGEVEKQDPSQIQLADYFDVISGTSTGSILTALLVTPLNEDIKENNTGAAAHPASTRALTLDQIISLYETLGSKIFTKSFGNAIEAYRKHGVLYPSSNLANVSEDLFKAHTNKDALTDFAIAFYDRKQAGLFGTRNRGIYQIKDENGNPVKWENPVNMSQLVASSSMVPPFFPFYHWSAIPATGANPYHFRATDGGAYQVDPTLLGITEARLNEKIMEKQTKISPANLHLHVISLGTGMVEGDAFGDLKINHVHQPKGAEKRLAFINDLASAERDSSAKAIDLYLTNDPNIDYLRLNIPLPKDLAGRAEDASPETIAAIGDALKKALPALKPELIRACRMIVSYGKPNRSILRRSS